MRQKSRKAREQSKNLYISTACYSENTNLMLKELRERIDMSPNKAVKESFWQLADDPLGISDWVREQPCKLELNNEKEKEKMEAKKCERCGKLYEMQDVENYITAYFPGLSVSDYSKENYSESRIRKDNTRIVSVNSRSGQVVDLCPECREKLKNFFESGKDETTVVKKAEE